MLGRVGRDAPKQEGSGRRHSAGGCRASPRMMRRAQLGIIGLATLSVAGLVAPSGMSTPASAVIVPILGQSNCSRTDPTCHTVWTADGVAQGGFPACCGIGKKMNFVVFDLTDYPTWNNEIVAGANQWGDEYLTPIDIKFNATANRPESWIKIYSDPDLDVSARTYYCPKVGNCNTQIGEPQNIHYAIIRINPTRVYDAKGSASEYLEAIVTHELGHAFGLSPHSSGSKFDGHLCSTQSVMQPPNFSIQQDADTDTWINDPTADDIGLRSCPGSGSAGPSGVACIYRSAGYSGSRSC